MTLSASRFAGVFLLGITAALPCAAESFASSASSAGSSAVGSLSDSIHDSSGSSKHDVAEGDYRIVDVAAPGDIVDVRQRSYGYQFAWADTGVAFFLALTADWQRDLETRPVQL